MDKRAAGKVVEEIEDVIRELEDMSTHIGAFIEHEEGSAEKTLFGHINSLVSKYEKIDGMRDTLNPGALPVDFLDHLDRLEQNHPDLYTRHKVDFCLEERERLRRITADIDVVKDTLQS
uniref:Mediator of RNA polymerase II transcription subunit 10 n=2 Tax=Mucochytrium quahogii TaxID=96639 RepID=A0A7S2RJS0_9STRA|mmetsp:Transcript_16619/g.26956  ORF Transcript_16619/g.26956 Transcript_16619/m.26956 type:complete len:119 (+) Transcript_16619:102-458(+)